MFNLSFISLYLIIVASITDSHVSAAKTAKSKKSKLKSATCPPFPHPYLEHGVISVSGSNKYAFQCARGYFLTTDREVRCWKGKWSSTQEPQCLKSAGTCDDPPEIVGGDALGSERHSGSLVQYVCRPGFVILGDGTRRCLPTGHWDGVTPACVDENEPLQKMAERLRSKFVVNLGSHSSDSVVVPKGKLLDQDSIKEGLELVILLDRSSSIDPVDFKVGVGFIKFLLQEFGVRNGNNTSGTRAAVISFGTSSEILFNLDNSTIGGPLAANRALDTLQANGGGTNLEAAFVSVLADLAPLRPKAKKSIFLLTDGEPNSGSDITPEDYALNLKRLDFEIFTVGIGKGINRKFLSGLASEPLFNHIFIIDKYSDLKNVMTMIQDAPPKPKPISPGRCGYVKDEKDYLKKWTWLAAIFVGVPGENNSTSFKLCGGTLICSQWVLTSASCFAPTKTENGTTHFDSNMGEVFVVLGEENLMETQDQQMNFYAEEIIIHPKFNVAYDLINNVALIKLNDLVPLNLFRPACLPPTDRPVPLHLNLNVNASIAGWGLQPRPGPGSGFVNGGTARLFREDTSVDLGEQRECRRLGRKNSEYVFCAGHGLNTCIGDMGSPVIAVDPGTGYHHAIGVLIRRSSCANGYNQYADITHYLNWINKATNQCHRTHYMT